MRILLVFAFVFAIVLGGVAGYLSVDMAPPQAPAASVAAKPVPAEVAHEGDYGPDWPVCRDMSNDPTLRFKACEALLNKGVLTQQHQSWALNNRGTANLGLGNIEAAMKDFTTASKIDPDNASPYLNLANVARRYGQLAEALELSDKALALEPSEYGYCSRAVTLRELGRVEEGLAAIDAAEKLGPLSDCSKLVRADLLEMRGQDDKALLALEGVGEDDGTASHSACERARLKIKEGKLKEGFDLYAEGMRRDPNNNCAAWHAAYWSSRVMPFDQALAFVEEAIKSHPKLPLLNCELGAILQLQGENRKALAAYEKAIKLGPDDSCGHVYRGGYWYAQGDYLAALKDYETGARLQPSDFGAWRGRGNTLIKLRRWQEAMASYNAVLAIEPKDTEAWIMRAEARFALQFYEDAIGDYDAALELSPKTTYLRYRMAVANFAARSPKAAIEACAQLPAEDAQKVDCQLLSAEAMLLEQDENAALNALELIAADSGVRRQSDLVIAGIRLMSGDIEAAKAVVDKHRQDYPDQLYGAVWSALIAQAFKTPVDPEVTALADDKDIWPTPVLHWLVRGGAPEELLAATDTPDPHLTLQRRGEAEFYLGLSAMLAGEEKEAAGYFAKAMKSGYAEQDKNTYPAAYSFSNGREFALATWAASGGR